MSGRTTNDGLDSVRDHFQEVVTEIGVGSGTDDPTRPDDELHEEVGRKSVETETAGTGEAEFTVRLKANEANDELAEVGTFDEDDALLTRLTHSSFEKTEEFEIEYQLTKKAENK